MEMEALVPLPLQEGLGGCPWGRSPPGLPRVKGRGNGLTQLHKRLLPLAASAEPGLLPLSTQCFVLTLTWLSAR